MERERELIYNKYFYQDILDSIRAEYEETGDLSTLSGAFDFIYNDVPDVYTKDLLFENKWIFDGYRNAPRRPKGRPRARQTQIAPLMVGIYLLNQDGVSIDNAVYIVEQSPDMQEYSQLTSKTLRDIYFNGKWHDRLTKIHFGHYHKDLLAKLQKTRELLNL